MQEVEWDFTTEVALALRDSDGVRATGVQRDPAHNIDWRPLAYDYPENYAPRFPRLLGSRSQYRYDGNDDTVHISFLNADFSSTAVRGALKEDISADLAQRLQVTDWLVIESLELGTPLDPEVSAERARLRAKADEVKSQVDTIPVSELLEFNWTLEQEEEATPQ